MSGTGPWTPSEVGQALFLEDRVQVEVWLQYWLPAGILEFHTVAAPALLKGTQLGRLQVELANDYILLHKGANLNCHLSQLI